MSEVNFERMLEICNRFVDTNPIDYYQLFGLDKDMNLMELKKDIKNKKIRVMFHPDQIGVVPDEYKATFQKICDSIPDLDNVFYSKENKEKYDNSLANAKDSDKTIIDEEENITELEKTNFENAIVKTASKYGVRQMVGAIKEAMNNNFNGFTSDGHARDIVEALGYDKIRKIVLEASCEDMNNPYFKMDFDQLAANYMSELINKIDFFSIQVKTIRYAIEQTLSKYPEAQVHLAMNRYADRENSTSKSITSKGDARRYMEMYVNPKDVKELFLLMNNQNRFNDASCYYMNAKPQSIDYQIDLYMYGEKKKNQSYNAGPQY